MLIHDLICDALKAKGFKIARPIEWDPLTITILDHRPIDIRFSRTPQTFRPYITVNMENAYYGDYTDGALQNPDLDPQTIIDKVIDAVKKCQS